MDNASELADYLDDQREKMEEATAEMWKMMAGWTPRADDRRRPARLLRRSLKDVAHFAGVYEQDDWFTVDERAQRFKPLLNDEYGNSAIAELVGLVSLHLAEPQPAPHGAATPNARGEMWTPIPYSVLADDEWTAARRPDPAPAAPRCRRRPRSDTTTQGKLTQDECNAAAKAFRSSALRPALLRRRHLDQEQPRRSEGGGALGGPGRVRGAARAAAPGSARRSWRSCAPRRAADPRARASPRA